MRRLVLLLFLLPGIAVAGFIVGSGGDGIGAISFVIAKGGGSSTTPTESTLLGGTRVI